MRYAIFTSYGESLPIAIHLQNEGCEVHFGILDDLNELLLPSEHKEDKEDKEDKEKRLRLGEGILKHIYDANKLAKIVEGWDDGFVFCDFNNLWRLGERLEKTGLPGMYPHKEDREWEIDREKAKEFVKKNYPDLKIGDAKEYSTSEEAVKDLEKNTKESHVLKGFSDFASTIVPDANEPEEDNEQIADVLTKDSEDYEKEGFLLEKKIENAKEKTPEMWFFDGEPIFAIENIETKRMNDGETGPMTGCSSGLVFPIDIKSKICEMAFPKAVYDMAAKRKGIFIWDASILFDPKTGEGYFGEYCPNRVGYDCFFGELALCKSCDDFFSAVAEGKNPFEKRVADFAATLRLFMLKPGGTGMKVPEDVLIKPPEGRETDFWPLDIYRNKDKKDRTTGNEYQSAVVTGVGNTPKAAIKDACLNGELTNLRGKTARTFKDITSKENYSLTNRYDYGLKEGLY